MSARNHMADKVWRDLTRLVLDNKDTWRRTAVAETGLPFSRIRILLRLARSPMTVKEVASAATMDAPAATVAVNDLEDRGLVVREIRPNNRRSKTVSLTAPGRELVAMVEAIEDPAPESLLAVERRRARPPSRPSSPRSSASGLPAPPSRHCARQCPTPRLRDGTLRRTT